MSSRRASLPDELIVDIIARVPRRYYPTISLVSRRFRAIIASPEIYVRRSFLGCTEPCLYAVLCNKETNRSHLYMLNGNGLVLIPSLPTLPSLGYYFVVGSKIFGLVGRGHGPWTSSGLTIDCRFYTAQPITNTPKLLSIEGGGIIDEKIHVIGECKDKNSLCGYSKWTMAFNTETQMWEPEMRKSDLTLEDCLWSDDCAVVMEDKIYMKDYAKSFFYAPKESKWEFVEMLHSKKWEHACAIGDILYYCDTRKKKLRAYDPKQRCWRVVNGVEGLVPESVTYWWPHTVNHGEKLVVFLSRVHNETEETRCAVIALERRQGGEIWGEVEWSEVVFRGSFFVDKILSVMV